MIGITNKLTHQLTFLNTNVLRNIDKYINRYNTNITFIKYLKKINRYNTLNIIFIINLRL